MADRAGVDARAVAGQPRAAGDGRLSDCPLCAAVDERWLVADDGLWRVVHDTPPVAVAGKLYVTLQRHAESLDALTPAEASALGPVLARCVRALRAEGGVERVHVGSYGEQVAHVHVHVTPRRRWQPPGNVPFAVWQLAAARLRRGRGDDVLDALVGRLRRRVAVAQD